jgi:hypothetical protein
MATTAPYFACLEQQVRTVFLTQIFGAHNWISEVAIMSKRRDGSRNFMLRSEPGSSEVFSIFMHDDFRAYVPNYSPWGGFHERAAHFVKDVLPQVLTALDFRRFISYLKGNHAWPLKRMALILPVLLSGSSES